MIIIMKLHSKEIHILMLGSTRHFSILSRLWQTYHLTTKQNIWHLHILMNSPHSNKTVLIHKRSCGCSVSIVSEYRLNDQGLIPSTGKGFFPLLRSVSNFYFKGGHLISRIISQVNTVCNLWYITHKPHCCHHILYTKLRIVTSTLTLSTLSFVVCKWPTLVKLLRFALPSP
jgi:hypothetical protein